MRNKTQAEEKTKVVQIRFPEGVIKRIDEIIENEKEYSSRQDFIKDKLRDILKKEDLKC